MLHSKDKSDHRTMRMTDEPHFALGNDFADCLPHVFTVDRYIVVCIVGHHCAAKSWQVNCQGVVTIYGSKGLKA